MTASNSAPDGQLTDAVVDYVIDLEFVVNDLEDTIADADRAYAAGILTEGQMIGLKHSAQTFVIYADLVMRQLGYDRAGGAWTEAPDAPRTRED